MSARGRWLLLFKWSPEPPNEPGAIHLILQKTSSLGDKPREDPAFSSATVHPDNYERKEHEINQTSSRPQEAVSHAEHLWRLYLYDSAYHSLSTTASTSLPPFNTTLLFTIQCVLKTVPLPSPNLSHVT